MYTIPINVIFAPTGEPIGNCPGGDRQGNVCSEFTGIVIIVGNYGSGKTEIAINLAIAAHADGRDVAVVDLDLVNPYFRTRDARALFAAKQIPLVLPGEQYMHADLPILAPEVGGLLREPKDLTILDLGGDDVGTTVLAALADQIGDQPVEMLQVINPNRPVTDTIEGCVSIQSGIEQASGIAVTGYIGNAHFMGNTAIEDVMHGYAFCETLVRHTGKPLRLIAAPAALADAAERKGLSCPVLPIHRQLVPPWERSAAIG